MFSVREVMIGDFTDGHIHWSPPEKFAELKAFDPVAVGLDTNRIVRTRWIEMKGGFVIFLVYMYSQRTEMMICFLSFCIFQCV